MPIRSSGPMKMRKFAMNRNVTNTIWIQRVGFVRIEPILSGIAATRLHQVGLSPAGAWNHLKAQITVITMMKSLAMRSQKPHVQARRRLTMSSSRRRLSSVPKRLGQGIARRIRMSVTPRKTTQIRKV
jgi:hypothetical protein